MKYRPEIDGLRAVAVLPVILFHAGISIFSGGYIGVDVFFVISGFLITTIIMNESAQGKFTIRNFYIRRARRILPALFTVLLACIFFAYLWMLPAQLTAFSKSVFSALFFYSNFYFWKQDGYFAEASDEMPLLHIWSLAVEEQYYLIFPVIIILLWRYKKEYIPHVIVAGAIISFALAEYMSRSAPVPSFYLAHTRAWELFIGSLAAIYTLKKTPAKNNLLSAIGLTLIIYSIFFFSETTRWPSAFTLAPTIGTALILLYGSAGTFVYKILSLRAFVGIGLISYSAYLWHHSLFAFARIRNFEPPSMELMLTLSVASLILAYFSWKYIETPFRKGKSLFGVQPLKLAIGFTILLSAIAIFGYKSNGFPQRFSEDIQRIVAAKEDYDRRSNHCNYDAKHTNSDIDNCWMNESNDKSVMLIGDSHADILVGSLAKSLGMLNTNLLKYVYSGCIPLANINKNSSASQECDSYNNKILSYLTDNPSIDILVLDSRWQQHFENSLFDNQEGGAEKRNKSIDIFSEKPDSELTRKTENLTATKTHIQKLLAMGKKIVIIYPVPETGWNVPDYTAAQSIKLNYVPEVSTSYELFKKRTHDTFTVLDSIKSPNLYRFYPHKYLCSDVTERCMNANKDAVYYIDDDHLSLTGVRLFADDLAKLIKSIPID